MAYGLNATGFVRPRLPDIQTELEDAYKLAFGEGIDLGGDSVFGELIGIHSEREAVLWELLEMIYYSAFPDHATGVALQNAAAITGTVPLKATYSVVEGVLLEGTPGTVLPAGRVLSVDPSGARFATTGEYIIGDDGTVEATFTAEETGPVAAPVGTLTVIETPVSGWDSATNPAEAELGRNAETDTELRLRRARRLVTAGGGAIPALERRLRDVEDVTFVGVRQNRTDATVDGLPPHSLEAIVIGGEDQALWDVMWDAAPAGIEQVGTEVGTVVDSFGNNQTVKFSRGTEVTVYLVVEPVRGTGYPADGDQQIEDALVAYGATLGTGDDLLNWLLVKAVPELEGLEGIVIKQGTAPAPSTSANIAIGANEVAILTASTISFT